MSSKTQEPVEVEVKYGCGCGFKTYDLEEAKLHVLLKGHTMNNIVGFIKPKGVGE